MSSQDGTTRDQMVAASTNANLKTSTIGHTLERLGQCSKLLALVRENGLESRLGRSGLQTLLAPSDEALQAHVVSNPEQFLDDHLLRGGFETFDLRRTKQLKMNSGRTIPVEAPNGVPRVGNANIVKRDVPCTNGVIQVIDRVL